MPIIIDANRAADFRKPCCPASNILACVHRNRTKIAVGGKLTKELGKTPLLSLLVEMSRSGNVVTVRSEDLDAEIDRINIYKCESNDRHIIALARISGSRLLYTDDNYLISDFRNANLLSPRGKVIKTTTPGHAADSLLRKFGI